MANPHPLKIVFIGAASAVFGPVTIYDVLTQLSTDTRAPTLALVDTDSAALLRVHRIAEAMARQLGVEAAVESSTDRREVLAGAHSVIVAAEADRIERWRLDWEIPRRFGIRHTLGENRGPAGLSHTLRTVPLVLDIASDIEELSPEATVIIMTNPEDRVAYAVNHYTGLRAYGYCDGLWDFKHHYLEPLLGIPGERIFVEAAGINHAVWITTLRDTKNHDAGNRDAATGVDLYPRLLAETADGSWQPLGRHLYERYGLWPHENDEHYGEYFPYACELIECPGYDFDAHLREERQWRSAAEEVIAGTRDPARFTSEVADAVWEVFGDAPPSAVIRGVHLGAPPGGPQYLHNANIANRGHIPGLPDDMVVEIPGLASPAGVHGVGMHRLGPALLSFLQREGTIQRLSAEAAAEGSRTKALTALELDPHVGSPATAEALLDAFLEAHRGYVRESLGG